MTDEEQKKPVVFDTSRKRLAIGIAKATDCIAIAAIAIGATKLSSPLRNWKFWATTITTGVISGVANYWSDRVKSETEHSTTNSEKTR